jgi:flagellar hook assembly protein FlgD
MKFLLLLFCILNSFLYSQPSEFVSIDISKIYFTPNQDGLLDTIVFNLTTNEKKEIADWKFTITNENGTVIKFFDADLKIKKEVKYLYFQKKEENPNKKIISIPNSIEWTGVGIDGKIPPDGKYLYQLTVYFSDKTKWDSIPKYIFIDKNIPRVKLHTDSKLFIPNSEKQNQFFSITQIIKAEQTDRWFGTIYNFNNLPIKTYIWDSKILPKVLSWDGKDDRGIPMDSGYFTYELVGIDFAENKYIAKIENFLLSRTDTYEVFSNIDEFSPNDDNVNDTVKFYLQTIGDKKISYAKLSLASSKKPLIDLKTFTYYNSIPTFIEWDGKDDNSKLLPDDEYIYTLNIILKNGQGFTSLPKKIKLNSVRPIISANLKSNNITPDNDGVDDFLEIFPKVDNFPLKTWKISIVERYTLDNKPKSKIVKQWKGYSNLPNRIIWDGISEDGLKITSFSKFDVIFSIRNFKNEHKTYLINSFESGIILDRMSKTQHSISIPEYSFRNFGDDYIIKQLQKFFEIYPKYNIELQSHSKQPGDNQYNLQRTEKRAIFLYEKIFGAQPTLNKFNYRGFGEIELKYQDLNEYKQEKNDRIDFIFSLEN